MTLPVDRTLSNLHIHMLFPFFEKREKDDNGIENTAFGLSDVLNLSERVGAKFQSEDSVDLVHDRLQKEILKIVEQIVGSKGGVKAKYDRNANTDDWHVILFEMFRFLSVLRNAANHHIGATKVQGDAIFVDYVSDKNVPNHVEFSVNGLSLVSTIVEIFRMNSTPHPYIERLLIPYYDEFLATVIKYEDLFVCALKRTSGAIGLNRYRRAIVSTCTPKLVGQSLVIEKYITCAPAQEGALDYAIDWNGGEYRVPEEYLDFLGFKIKEADLGKWTKVKLPGIV